MDALLQLCLEMVKTSRLGQRICAGLGHPPHYATCVETCEPPENMPEGLRRQLLSAAFETADAVKASFEDDAVRLARKPRLRTTTRLYMLERVALVRWKAARDNARERRWNSLSREMVPKSLSRYNTHIYTGNETLSLSLSLLLLCVFHEFFSSKVERKASKSFAV